MPEDPIVTPPETPVQDNSQIKQMRERIDAQNAELKSLKDTVRASELEKLGETERLKVQLAEYAPFKEKAERLETFAKSQYDATLSALPADVQEKALALSASGDFAERLSALKEVESLVLTARKPSLPAGTVTSPVLTTHLAAAPVVVDDPKNALSNYFANSRAKLTDSSAA